MTHPLLIGLIAFAVIAACTAEALSPDIAPLLRGWPF
jgi:hypothetical protein